MRYILQKPLDSQRSSRAFTLVELLIGVTVSAIIMVGVAIFVGSGIENSFKIQKGISENQNSHTFDSALGELVAFGGELAYSGTFDAPYKSGAVFISRKSPIPIWTLVTKSVTGVCDAYSETSDNPWTGTVLALLWLYRPDGVKNDGGLFVDHTGHVIRNGGGVVIGMGLPSDVGGNGSAPLATWLRFPTAVLDTGGGTFLIADSGNDRVLSYDGSTVQTFVDSSAGIRHPYDFATDGQTIGILQNGIPFVIFGASDSNGASFSWSFSASAPFSFDSVRITLGGGRTPPANFGAYSFDFIPTSGTASVVGSTATLSFSGAFHTYSAGQNATIRVTGIPTSPAANGWHTASVEYRNGASTIYQRVFPYFLSADGNPLTLNDNRYGSGESKVLVASNPTFSWTDFAYSAFSAFSSTLNSAPIAESWTSTRLVDNLRVDLDTKVVTIRYFEYLRYDCLWAQHVKRERVLKIPID